MNTNKILKKRIIIFTLSFLFIITCSVITLIVNNNKTVIKTPSLKVTYKNKYIKTIGYPLKYDEGLTSPDNIITIENKTDNLINYQIKLIVEEKENNLELDKIYASVDDKEGVLLSNLINDYIYEGILNKKEKENVNLKIWIAKEYINDDDINKELNIKIDVNEK